jgi:uncharacterized protein
MHPVIASQQAALVALCSKRGVQRLELFGSAVRGDDTEASDFDFLVDLGAAAQGPLEAYFGLKRDLETLLKRPVDLVSKGSVLNPYVRASIDRDRVLVFAA